MKIKNCHSVRPEAEEAQSHCLLPTTKQLQRSITLKRLSAREHLHF